MFKSITQHGALPIFGLIFKVFLLAFTGLNTYHLLYALSGDPVWSLIGVALFEGALLYWWNMFRSDIEPSIGQIAISLLMFITSLLLVLAASALHLSAISPDALGPNTIPRVIVLAVAVNLGASLIHSILSPNVANEVVKRTVAGIVWSKAQAALLNQTDSLAADLTKELTAQTWDYIESDVRRQANRSLGSKGAVVIPGNAAITAAPVSNSTHDAPRHDDDPAIVPLMRPAAPGQGQRPNGPPAPTIGRRSPDGAPDF